MVHFSADLTAGQKLERWIFYLISNSFKDGRRVYVLLCVLRLELRASVSLHIQSTEIILLFLQNVRKSLMNKSWFSSRDVPVFLHGVWRNAALHENSSSKMS